VIGHGWRILWIGSLVLTAVCGFAYGWQERLENPPLFIMTRGKEPPEDVLLRKGRYDQAANVILASINNEKKDYFKYQSVATVYYVRATKDRVNREKWIGQAASYEAKSVSIAPNDPTNVASAAFGLDRIADVSSQPCPYYQTASQYAQDAMGELKSDAIFVGDEKMPTQPIRDDLEKLLGRISGKINAKCQNKQRAQP